MKQKHYIVHLRFTTRTGPETYANVSAYLSCDENTTIKEIQKWVNKKPVAAPISLEICELEDF